MHDIKNLFPRECLVLSCGPSLNKYSPEQLIEFAENKSVIAIKQAIYKIPEYTDIHLFNCSNLPTPKKGVFYDYSALNTHPIVIASSNYPKHFRIGNTQKVDYFLQVQNSDGISKDKCLAFTRDYDNWTYEVSPSIRKIGPGIMLETLWVVLYHIGVTKFYTLGIDLNKQGKNYPHFWDNTDVEKDISIKGTMIDWDVQANVDASESLYDWLQTKQVDWNVIGDSALSEKIPRYKL